MRIEGKALSFMYEEEKTEKESSGRQTEEGTPGAPAPASLSSASSYVGSPARAFLPLARGGAQA